MSLSRVTFEPRLVLLWALHGVKGEAMAVNEADRHCVESVAKGKATKV